MISKRSIARLVVAILTMCTALCSILMLGGTILTFHAWLKAEPFGSVQIPFVTVERPYCEAFTIAVTLAFAAVTYVGYRGFRGLRNGKRP